MESVHIKIAFTSMFCYKPTGIIHKNRPTFSTNMFLLLFILFCCSCDLVIFFKMPPTNKKPNLTDAERASILQFLLTFYDDKNKCNSLAKGAINAAAEKFGIHRSSVSHIWRRACLSYDKGELPADVRNRKRVIVHPKIVDRDSIKVKVKAVPFRQRQNLRSLSAASGVHKLINKLIIVVIVKVIFMLFSYKVLHFIKIFYLMLEWKLFNMWRLIYVRSLLIVVCLCDRLGR